MSRTYKDKDFYLRFPEEKFDFGSEKVTYEYEWLSMWTNKQETCIGCIRCDIAGAKTKKPRHYKGDWKWYKRTPSWFVREFMTAPKRAACRNWEKQAIYADDLEDFKDCPDFGRKPHVYYY